MATMTVNAKRRSEDFRASLPRLRFGRRVACKVLIKNDFSMRDEPRKNFYPEFPVAAGKGEVALPCRLWSLWRRGRRRLGRRGCLPLAAARDRKHSAPRFVRTAALYPAPAPRQPERAYVAFPQPYKPLSAKEGGKLLFPLGHNPCHTRFR